MIIQNDDKQGEMNEKLRKEVFVNIYKTPESREKSVSNLRPFKKGETSPHNRRGRRTSIIVWISKLPTPKLSTGQLFKQLGIPKRKIFKQLGIPKRKITYEEGILLRLAHEAFKGDMRAIELWLDRKYGRVTTPVDVTTTNDGPLVLIQNLTKAFPDEKIIDVPVEQLPANPTEYPTDEECQ